MKIGYARVSTLEQEAGIQAQLRDLQDCGCEKIFHDRLSGTNTNRPDLELAIKVLRKGDHFIVTKVDRLARSRRDFFWIWDRIQATGAIFVVKDLNIDTSSPMGEFLMGIMAGLAQLEVGNMKERQREGIKFAKRTGKYRNWNTSRKRRRDPNKSGSLNRPRTEIAAEILRLDTMGVPRKRIAANLRCSRSTIYVVLTDAGRISPTPSRPGKRSYDFSAENGEKATGNG